MGDRFYESQKTAKGGRKLKADWVKDINGILGTEISGLDKCTVKTLQELYECLKNLNT